MKMSVLPSFLLLAALSGPALAETPVKATPADACPLVGPLTGASAECAELRGVYRAGITACMDRMRAEADALAGQRTAISSHTNRSRYLICDLDVREKMALLVN